MFPADLSEPGAGRALWEAVTDADREVDAPANNAGFGSYGPSLEDDLETDRAPVALHVTTATALTKLFGRDVAEHGVGYVPNDASVAGWTPPSGSTVYSAAKHHERAFPEAIAEKLDAEGTTCRRRAPGRPRPASSTAATTGRPAPPSPTRWTPGRSSRPTTAG